MDYEQRWKILADLLVELRNRGEEISIDIMEDLRAAKSMIQILKADPMHIENIPKVEAYLGIVESNLIFTAEKVGSNYVASWLAKLDESRKVAKINKGNELASKFVVGIPKGQHWIRIKISEQNSEADLKKLAKENKLEFKLQENKYMLSWGSTANIKKFVARLKEQQSK